MLVLDIEGFSDRHRDDSSRTVLRERFYALLHESLAGAGIPWQSCHHEDRGDGAIVLVSPLVPKVLLLDPLLSCLSAALAEHNRSARVGERFRLRLAVHAGEVSTDRYGLSGTDLITACRMADADELRASLRESPVDLAVVVSDTIYEGTVRHRYRNLDPVDYHPVSLEAKKARIRAWMYRPSGVVPPPAPTAGARESEQDCPHQVPPSLGVFAGRERELDALDRAAPGLVLVVGPPGVGKSALAVRWANRAKDRFVDGCLYADLGGPLAPVPPGQVLRRFLRALGVPDVTLPADPAEQADLFRTVTSGRRILVVLDHAGSLGQVRALLPSPSTTTTVVTGSSRLDALTVEGAQLIELGPLSAETGVHLMSVLVGRSRVAAEPDALARLVELCGGLPVALVVAAGRLAHRRQWTVQQAVADLLDERRRLDRLALGAEPSVRAVFDRAYRELSPGAARLYRLLGLHPGPDFDAEAAAALIQSRAAEAEERLEELLGADLLQERQTGRFRLLDLVLLHARERAETEESHVERHLATRRLADWYLYTAAAADAVLTPHRRRTRPRVEHVPLEPPVFADHLAALRWLVRERRVLHAVARQAVVGTPAVAWRIADAMWGLFLTCGHHQDWLAVDELALDAARRCGDREMEAESEDRLGLALNAVRRYGEALEHMAGAARFWEELGRPVRVASSIERTGFVHLEQGRVDLAIDRFGRALALYRTLDQSRNVGLVLVSLARASIAAGRPEDAVRHARTASAYLGGLDVPDPYNLARCYTVLARAEAMTGRTGSALPLLQAASALMRAVGSVLGAADIWWVTAELHRTAGEAESARDAYRRAVELLATSGSPASAEVRERLANLEADSDETAWF
ncbi:NB-ARC domain-containing protein [Actinophytocola xanthii]|nr:NB-ARC domain-containing protein [Actinophytocola xanthii]